MAETQNPYKINRLLVLSIILLTGIVIALLLLLYVVFGVKRVGSLNTIDISCTLESADHTSRANTNPPTDIQFPIMIPSQGVSVRAIDSSHDYSLIAVGYDNGKIIIWDSNNQNYLELSEEHLINDISFVPNSHILAFATTGRQISLWDIDENNRLDQISVDSNGQIEGLLFIGDSSILIYTLGKEIHLYDVASGSECGKLTHDYQITEITISSNGQYLIYGSIGGESINAPVVGLIDLTSGTLINEFYGHTSTILALSSNDSHEFIASSDHETIKVWNIEEEAEELSLSYAASSIDFVGDNDLALIIDQKLHRLQFDVESAHLSLEPTESQITAIFSDHDSDNLASVHVDGTITLQPYHSDSLFASD